MRDDFEEFRIHVQLVAHHLFNHLIRVVLDVRDKLSVPLLGLLRACCGSLLFFWANDSLGLLGADCDGLFVL